MKLDPAVLALFGTITAAGIAAFGAWLKMRRQLSGQVKSTEAATLWEAQEQMRTWSERQIKRLEEAAERCEDANVKLSNRVRDVEAENAELRRQNVANLEKIASLERKIGA